MEVRNDFVLAYLFYPHRDFQKIDTRAKAPLLG